MINKKILLSLLTVGLLACVASAATWAYFQDSLDVNNTRITTANLSSEYSLSTDNWVPFYEDTGNIIGPFNITNIIPSETTTTLQYIKIRNMGNSPASVTAMITPTSFGVVRGLTVSIGTIPIYTDGIFNSTTSFPVPLSVGLSGTRPVDASISYHFNDNNDSQNTLENQSLAFDMRIVQKAAPLS
jgi:predicted ribosomally synthesized peptide with SipW-like signal peptide